MREFTKKYVCYNKDGAIVAIIFTDKVDAVVRGSIFDKWEFDLYTKDHLYIGVINCHHYECEEFI